MPIIKISDRYRRQWFWFFVFLISFIVLIIGLYIRMISVRSAALEAEKEERLQPVRTQPINITEVWKTATFLARIEGSQTIDISADVGGWVVERTVVRGQKVEKDQVLIVLEDARKTLKLKESEGRVKSAKADLKELRRKLAQTKTLLDKGIAAKDTLASFSNQVQAKTAEVDALEASFDLMQWDVDHLKVRSPIAGQVVDILPDIGQEVSEGDLLARIVNISKERVVAGVQPRLARLMYPGMKINLSKTSNGELQMSEGEIIGVSRDVDSSSGTYEIEAKILNNEYDWWPGEVVNMEVPVELLEDVIKIPRAAVLSDSNNLFVFVYKDGKALKVPVKVTWINEKEGAIPSNMIPEGTQVIIEGHVGLAGGQLVRLIQ